jgi:diketogulonate reductase-like aldo/keto reductase
MKFETNQNITLPKIGFGTWKIGGGSYADPKTDPASKEALRSALEIGYTHFDTAEMYANGHAEELLGDVVRESKVEREALFVTSKVMPSHLQYEQVLQSCEASLRRLKMEYLDLYLIHWPSPGMRLEDTFRALNKLVRDGKVKRLGVSNFNLKLLKQSQTLCETPIITDQVSFSLSDQSYIKNGVLEYCRKNDIFLTAYSPLNEGRLHSNKTIEGIARSHHATPWQIALAWVISQPKVITIPMSANRFHQKENFEASEIELTSEEISRLSNLYL